MAARIVTLYGREIPLSIWWPFVYLWQDALVALIFFTLDATLKRPRIGWIAYGALVGYVALNVPIARVLSTPLTWTMLRAARGPLADSILHYVTAPNLAALAVPLVVGTLLPAALARRRIRWRPGYLVGAAAVIAIGALATSRADTLGTHRNALGALVETSVERVASVPGSGDWRISPFERRATDDLSPLRGLMKGRNVVVVVLESTGAGRLGLYGGTPDPAPNLTQLATHAVVFERAYAVYPESVKGLFSVLCSRYPAFDTAPETYAGVPCASFAQTLGASGYRTALFHSGRFMYLGMRSVIDHRGFEVMEDAGDIGGHVDSSFGIDDESTVRRMLRWIDSVEPPFLVTYLPTAGHNPYVTSRPGPFTSPSDFWRYMNALHEGDAALGTLVDGLRARHLDERTVFIVFGDHGEAFGEHPGNFAHTLFIHEENVRVPYVVVAPGAIRGQVRVSRVASVLDTAPTLLDLLGLPAVAAHQGTSLLRAEPRMALFYTDYSLGWLGLADACAKYLYEIDSRRSRLFDVCVDPGETRDRASEYPDRVDAYRARVLAWAEAQRDLINRPQ